MRPTPQAIVMDAAQSPHSSCYPNTTCTQQVHGSGKFEAVAAMILIILLCAIICAIALNISIRCSLRRRSHQLEQTTQQHHMDMMTKPNMQTQVFTVEMELTECAICLSEFVGGDEIWVMKRCNHGFHAHCIYQWLSSHTSCPTCRASIA